MYPTKRTEQSGRFALTKLVVKLLFIDNPPI